jgi:HD superfamily phosphodiesterase
VSRDVPAWEQALRQELLEITSAAARRIWPGVGPNDPPYYNYRFEHVRQVLGYAERLHIAHGGDRDVIRAAVWIHDRAKPQFRGEDHAEKAGAWAAQHLADLGFPAPKVPAVVFAVRHHVGFVPPRNLVGPEAMEARILFDADKLDKNGLHSVLYRHLALAARPGQPFRLAHAAQPQRPLPKDSELDSLFFLPASVEIARGNLARLRRYYRDLREELSGDEGPPSGKI